MVVELGDLMGVSMAGTIMPRIQIKDGDDTEGCMKKVLVPKAISNGRVNHEDVAEYLIKKDAGLGRMTVVDDIVIKLTTPYECALITMEDEDLIVPSYCMILREFDTEKVDLDYLVGYLNTEYAKAQFSAGVAAATNSMLKMKDVQAIKVPLPPLEKQKRLGRLYRLSAEKQIILKKMLGNEMKLTNSLITTAAVEEMQDEQ